MNYRFYFLDCAGHILAAKAHQAEDDLEALEAAQILSRNGPIEVWAGARLVARVAKGGAAETSVPPSLAAHVQQSSF
jgi:hypothetical protein